MSALARACLLLLVAGCARAYKPPTSADPHAVVKVRQSYDEVAGKFLRESVLVDKRSAFSGHGPAETASEAHIDALLVHPRAAEFRVATKFVHSEMQQVNEPYTAYERQGTTSVQVTKYRWVTRSVEVVDGKCEQSLSFAPEDKHVYLLQYTYRHDRVCELACYEQAAGEGSDFRQKPCR